MTPKNRTRAALTLMELLITISLLAIIALVAIPKLIDVYERSRSGVQAYSLADSSRMIENFYGLNQKYPDGWDSLMDSTGAALYSELAAEIESPNTLLTTATLTDAQVASLSAIGISHVFLHDSTSEPNFSSTDRRHLGAGNGHDGTANINVVAAIDKTTGSEGLNLLVNNLGLNPNKSATDTSMPTITNNIFVVLGLGHKTTLVQSMTQGAPVFPLQSNAVAYGRALAVFMVPNDGTTRNAKFVGLVGPDGRTIREAISDYRNPAGPVPH